MRKTALIVLLSSLAITLSSCSMPDLSFSQKTEENTAKAAEIEKKSSDNDSDSEEQDNVKDTVGNSEQYRFYDFSSAPEAQMITVRVGSSYNESDYIDYLLDPQLDLVYLTARDVEYAMYGGGVGVGLTQVFCSDGTPMTIEKFLEKYPFDLSAWGY